MIFVLIALLLLISFEVSADAFFFLWLLLIVAAFYG
jgi:hypothetical protein